MTRINYNPTKRIAEQTDRIRRIAAGLPAGKRNALLNACGYIDLHARKRTDYTAPDPKEESTAIGDRYNSEKAIIAALLSGRELSHYDRDEFRTTEWHTRICGVRKILARQYPQYILRDRTASDGRHPYKIYWIESL